MFLFYVPSLYVPFLCSFVQWVTVTRLRIRFDVYSQVRVTRFGCTVTRFGCTVTRFGCTVTRFGCTVTRFGCTVTRFGCTVTRFGCTVTRFGCTVTRFGCTVTRFKKTAKPSASGLALGRWVIAFARAAPVRCWKRNLPGPLSAFASPKGFRRHAQAVLSNRFLPWPGGQAPGAGCSLPR